MNISDKPTNRILARAHTDSEWDSCDFAIITLSEDWRKMQFERLEAITPFANDLSFFSLHFFDGAADFYQHGDDGLPDIDELLGDNEWAFVELTQEEQDNLTPPGSALDCYEMVLYKDGDAKYTAYGKHTDEEFWTTELPLRKILEQL